MATVWSSKDKLKQNYIALRKLRTEWVESALMVSAEPSGQGIHSS